MKKEIGGYLELDEYHLPMLHDGAIALNSARNALAYLLKARKIKKLKIPKFICDSVIEICKREEVDYSFYSITPELSPINSIELKDDEWIYYVNYYSQFDNSFISDFAKRHQNRIIVDNVQSYYQQPVEGLDTIYTCRKYFGVPDGAFLYTSVVLEEELPLDKSLERMHYLLGRYEENASDYYGEYVRNEEKFSLEPIKRMSKLTNNLLHAVDYNQILHTRIENYSFYKDEFDSVNKLNLSTNSSTFMYPLLIENGYEIRKKLHEQNYYIPLLWPDVINHCSQKDLEYFLACNILPLPIDQRYSIIELEQVVKVVKALL